MLATRTALVNAGTASKGSNRGSGPPSSCSREDTCMPGSPSARSRCALRAPRSSSSLDPGTAESGSAPSVPESSQSWSASCATAWESPPVEAVVGIPAGTGRRWRWPPTTHAGSGADPPGRGTCPGTAARTSGTGSEGHISAMVGRARQRPWSGGARRGHGRGLDHRQRDRLLQQARATTDPGPVHDLPRDPKRRLPSTDLEQRPRSRELPASDWTPSESSQLRLTIYQLLRADPDSRCGRASASPALHADSS
jgi:hypothetical protein